MREMKTKSTSERNLAATAYHEAGHAAAAWLLGIKLRKVTITPEGDALGYVARCGIAFPKRVREALESGGSEREKAWAQYIAERHAIYCIAGIEAQKRFNPHSVRHYHAKADREAALEGLVRLAASNTILLYWRILKIRANNLLKNRGTWKAVKALADELMKRKTLSGDEAFEIMRNATAVQDEVVKHLIESSSSRLDLLLSDEKMRELENCWESGEDVSIGKRK